MSICPKYGKEPEDRNNSREYHAQTLYNIEK